MTLVGLIYAGLSLAFLTAKRQHSNKIATAKSAKEAKRELFFASFALP
jgi:hypothetical protein